MALSETVSVPTGTSSDDYTPAYYSHGDYEGYDWETERWREFFLSAAGRIRAMTNARTCLDVGCAKGLLVQALVAVGVDATGVDLSGDAIAGAHEDVRDRLSVASATEPIEGRYDLITCIEVLEHMSPTDAQTAIDRMCAASDLILFTSTPGHFDEPTHVNVRPTAEWVAAFAERGYFRRTDVNLDFLDALQPFERQYHLACLRSRAAGESGQSALRHHGDPRGVTGTQGR